MNIPKYVYINIHMHKCLHTYVWHVYTAYINTYGTNEYTHRHIYTYMSNK